MRTNEMIEALSIWRFLVIIGNLPYFIFAIISVYLKPESFKVEFSTLAIILSVQIAIYGIIQIPESITYIKNKLNERRQFKAFRKRQESKRKIELGLNP